MPEPLRDQGAEPEGPDEPRFHVAASPGGRVVDTAGLERFLEAIAEDISPGDARGASLRVVSDAAMRALNRTYRGKDQPTDVLAFPVSGPPADTRHDGGNHRAPELLVDPWPREEPGYLGDLVVSVDTASRQAAERGRPLDAELRHLALHGLLHLFGYDHEADRGEMARLERLLRLRHGLIPR